MRPTYVAKRADLVLPAMSKSFLVLFFKKELLSFLHV
jgi:hypothetical protein